MRGRLPRLGLLQSSQLTYIQYITRLQPSAELKLLDARNPAPRTFCTALAHGCSPHSRVLWMHGALGIDVNDAQSAAEALPLPLPRSSPPQETWYAAPLCSVKTIILSFPPLNLLARKNGPVFPPHHHKKRARFFTTTNVPVFSPQHLFSTNTVLALQRRGS
jgi:hypothetical protein